MGEGVANWKDNRDGHLGLIKEYLGAKYAFPHPPPDPGDARPADDIPGMYNENIFADRIAAILQGLLEHRAWKDGLAQMVPEGWTGNESRRHADIAFHMARICSQKRVNPITAITAYSTAVANSSRPRFDDMEEFQKIEFKTHDQKPVSGDELLRDAKAALDDYDRNMGNQRTP